MLLSDRLDLPSGLSFGMELPDVLLGRVLEGSVIQVVTHQLEVGSSPGSPFEVVSDLFVLGPEPGEVLHLPWEDDFYLLEAFLGQYLIPSVSFC